MSAVDPPRLVRWRHEPDEVDELPGSAAFVKHLHQVRQHVPAVVVGRGGVRLAPMAQLIVVHAGVLREFQCAEVAEASDPEANVMPPVRDADEFRADLLEIARRIVHQDVSLVGQKRPQADTEVVSLRSDGLERSAGRNG